MGNIENIMTKNQTGSHECYLLNHMYDTQYHNKHCQKKNTPANSISVNLPNAHTSAYVTWCHIMISVAVDMITWPIVQGVALQFFLYTYSKCIIVLNPILTPHLHQIIVN